MCSHWTEAKLFKFLRLYKCHECLWNPYSPEYRNSNKKSQSLSEIVYEMNIFGLTINECLKQIKYVRQTYKEEQLRLKRYVSLGGHTFSKLLWYPLMNSMLSKVIRDEEKLNQAQATGTLDLVVAPNQVPHNSLDEQSHRARNGTAGYRQRSLSWARSETTSIFSYPSNLGYGDYADRCPNRMVANNFSDNEHLGSDCPTCGYSNGSSCDCFSMYNSEIIKQQSSNGNYRSQIDYRPRTSYNYRNGILEINSAVRIPVSQPASNCGYNSHLMENITPEEPVFYHCDEFESHLKQPDFQNIEQVEEQSTKCCADSFNFNLDEYESLELMDSYYPSNLPINKNGVKCRLKRSERTKRINVDKILCVENSMGTIDAVGLNSTCDNISCEKRCADKDNNLKVHLECPKLNVIVEEESKTDMNTTCYGSNVEVKPISRTEDNTFSEISQVEVEGNEDSITKIEPYKFEVNLESSQSEEGKSDEQFLQELIDEYTRKKADSKPCADLVPKSKDVQRNLTKIVIAYISEILTKPIERTKIDEEEIIILKKVVKDLKLSLNKGHQKADNSNTKLCNKTICWREPIEDSLDIVPCRTTETPKMIGGADFESQTRKNVESSNVPNDCECFVSNDAKLCETKEAVHLDLEDVEMDGQVMKVRSNLDVKNCDNIQEFCDSMSSTEEKPEVENDTTIKVSIETSNGSTEHEILDKVVNKITDILRYTLDKNGYLIQKEQFFSIKNLTTNDDWEMSRNEAVWRSELVNIIGYLMKHKKADDPITFKVRTVIQPVENQSNISIPEAPNLTVVPKTRVENLKVDHKACYNSLMKNSSEFFGNIERKVSDGSKNGYKMIIDRSESILKKIRSLSARKLLDKIERKASDEEFKRLDSDISLYKSNREFQSRKKFFTNHIRKFKKRSRDIISDGRLLRNLTYLNKISIKDENQIVLLYNNDRHKLWKLLKCLVKFRNKSPSMLKEFENLSHNLQTEKNHSNAAGYWNKLLCHPVCNVNLYTQISRENDVDRSFRSVGSNTNDTQPKNSPDSFVTTNAVTQTRSNNKFWCTDRADKVGMLNSISRSTIEDRSMASLSNRLGVRSSLENNCHILNVFSSYNQNTSRRELKKSKEGIEASLCCDEEAEAMLEPEIRVAAENQTKSCCAGEKSSHLRLCTIVKPPNETRETNHQIESDNICCCDSINDSRHNFVGSTSTCSQTESIKREPQSCITDQSCGCNSVSEFRSVSWDQRDRKNSADINNRRSVLKDEEKLVDHSGLVMNDITVQSSIQDPLKISLDIPDSLDKESLVLEVRMLEPLFSIELKKRHQCTTKMESAERVFDQTVPCGSQTSLNEPEERLDGSRCRSIQSLDTSQSLENCQNEIDIQELKPTVTCLRKSEPRLEENSTVETEASTIGALISTVERSFQHITDPIFSQKLEDIIEYIRDQDQDQRYASTEKNEIKALHELSEDNTRQESVSLVTDGFKKCQRPCKSLPILTSINIRSTNVQEAQVNYVETESEHGEVDRNPQMKMTSLLTMQEMKLASADERNEFEDIVNHSESMMNYSYYGVEEVGSNVSCDQSIEERLNVAPSRCSVESDGVDINVFTSIVASKLRELSTEAALRSQRRIQTLISNSRLESEINKKVSMNR